LTKPYFISNL